MRWLTDIKKQLDSEQGGMAVAIGVLFFVVFLGFAALVIDSGFMFQERHELQNGADSAALAIAYACAREESDCTEDTSDGGLAATLASANTKDGLTDVTDVDIDLDVFEVTVNVQSLAEDDSNTFFQQLPSLFEMDPTTVVATTTVSWADNPVSLATMPLALSGCEFDEYFDEGDLDPDEPVRIRLLGGAQGGPDDCEAPAGGAVLDEDENLEGGFRWFDTDDGCEAKTEVDEWIASNQGISAPHPSCDAEFASMIDQTIVLPIFDDVCKGGGGAVQDCNDVGLGNAPKGYHIWGYFGFKLTGIKVESIKHGDTDCAPYNFCLNGYFRPEVADGPPGGPSEGQVSTPRFVR